MKSKIILSLLSIVLTSYIVNAQSDLHIPKEIQNAYKNGTRSMDGKPGANYWQNTVDYKINVNVTPETRGIKGTEDVVYTNNSPDELSSIVIRLYYDVFKKGNKRDMQVNGDDIGEGVDIKNVTIDGVEVDLSNEKLADRNGTNLELKLSKPLATGEKVNLSFEWEQKVPLTVRRTGAIDSTSFFVAYWYPQVAVYDDVFGWDRIDYTFATEFYNNLANFDVNITAPDNFLVWSTGTLENSADVLPAEIHKKYNKAKTSTELVNVVTAEELKTLKLKSNTWHYKASEVSDFAFALSDHYQWDALSQKVSGNDVLISSAFPTDKAEEYTEVTKVQQKAMKHFSEDVPGIPYPYPAFTTFIGLKGGGMEFPMMANNANSGKGVTIHEMFHTYFPMYVRINERRFAWMDEGWATFVTALVQHKYFKDEKSAASLYANYKMGLQGMIGSIGDLPTVTSTQYTSDNLGYQSYALPGFTYALLYQYLGEEKFLESFRTYIRRWAKKSPTPYDFFYTFENVSGEDLSWLWDSWYFKLGYPDVAIDSYKDGKLVVKGLGDRPVPISVYVEYESQTDGEKEVYETIVDASVWKNGNKEYTIDIPNDKKIESLIINADFPDFNEIDNYFPTLADRYKKFDLNKDVLGKYKVKEYPVNILISEEDGLYMMEISNSGIGGVLLPVDQSNFVTTDGGMKLKFTEVEGKITSVEMSISAYGITLNGTK